MASLALKLTYRLVAVLLAYATVEAGATWLFVNGHIEPESFWILEDTGKGPTISFDPVRGAWLSRTNPARMACVSTNGDVNGVGYARGNNHGFPDRDDFHAHRTPGGGKRYAVFGRSYSASLFLPKNWPDAVEDLARERGQPVTLMNMSVDGGGLVNWWSIMKRFLEPGGFQVDGLIIAVAPMTLFSGFTIWDDQLASCPGSSRCLAWATIPVFNPSLLPATREAARRFFVPQVYWQILPSKQLDRIIDGKDPPPFHRPFTPYLASRLAQEAKMLFGEPGDPGQAEMDTALAPLSGQGARAERPAGAKLIEREVLPVPPAPGTCIEECRRLIDDFRSYIKDQDIPAMVVYLPEPPLESKSFYTEARWLAAYLGISFVDGTQAFAGLTESQQEEYFLSYDGHFNSTGTKRFAKFMEDVLVKWEQ